MVSDKAIKRWRRDALEIRAQGNLGQDPELEDLIQVYAERILRLTQELSDIRLLRLVKKGY